MKKLLLGLDIGTTDIKAVLFDQEGKEIDLVRRKSPVLTPYEGFVEQDMNQLWDNICSLIQELLKKSPTYASQISGIGFSAQGEGCWLVDAKGSPVRTAILWNDIRTANLVDDVDESFKAMHKQITGSFPGPGGTNFILKWLSLHDKESLEKAKYCFFCKDWIRFKLTGVAAVEKTDMSTSLLDLETQTPSKKMFDLLGISQYYSLLPQLLDSYSLAGTISEEASAQTGLSKNTPVAAGYIDVISTMIGAGAVHQDDVCSIIGTSCINGYVSATFNTFSGNSAYLCHGNNKDFLCLIGSMAGTPNIEWGNKSIFFDVDSLLGFGKDKYQFIDQKISEIPVGSGGVIYHPYIKLSGERAPFLDIHARSNFFGISERTTRWHLLRAIYEGIAFSIKDCFQGHPISRIFLAGGGSNSVALAQIVSDCLGVPVNISESTELGAKGAALAAGVSSGLFPSIETGIQSFRNQTKEFTPNLVNTNIYHEFFEIYQGLREIYPPLWKKRKQILEKFQLEEGSL
ncbi:MAG: FGGY-family carbohydrate kinase [Brevinema sp.]